MPILTQLLNQQLLHLFDGLGTENAWILQGDPSFTLRFPEHLISFQGQLPPIVRRW